MSKSFILLLAILSFVFCVPRRRQPTYDEKKLRECLSLINIDLDEKVEELRGYHDVLRRYFFNKKFAEYGFDINKEEEMIKCFDQFGLKARTVSPYLNCMDMCLQKKKPGERCSCPRY